MNSIRSRLTLALLIGCLAVLGSAGVVIFWLTRNALFSGLDARLRVSALSIIQQTRQEPDDDEPNGRDLDVHFSDRYLQEFQRGGSEFYQVWRPEGFTVERSDSLAEADLPRETGTVEEPAFWTFHLPNGKPARAVGIKFVPESWHRRRRHHDPDFKASVVVAGELGPVAETLASLQQVLWAVGGLASLAVLIGVPWLVWKGFRPVDRLSSDASKIDANRLDFRFSTERLSAELQPIAQRLNELLARLEDSFARERRFSSDAAHELRTPLAELRTLAEVALKWPPDAAETRKAFQDTLEIAQRLESLVTGLLAIARCESGSKNWKDDVLDLPELIGSVWRRFEPQANAKELSVHLNLPERLPVKGNTALLQTILDNLFANAVEYSNRRGLIQLDLETNGEGSEGVAVSLANTTDNLGTDDIPHLFDRFWRKDDNRTDARHSGLGLAVVKAAAQALELEVSAAWQAPNRVIIRLSGLIGASSSRPDTVNAPMESEAVNR